METSSYQRFDRWMDQEVKTLLAIFGEDEIQRDLASPIRNDIVYARIAERLLSLGIRHSAKQVREKLKKLKQDYKKIKDHNNKNGYHNHRTSKWFDRLDALLGHRPTYTGTSQTNDQALRSSSEESQAAAPLNLGEWLPDEVQILLTLWAQETIQKQLLVPAADTQVFTYLSNELDLVGFSRTPFQCRLKIESLKAEYHKIQQTGVNGHSGSNWFAIMDSVLGPGAEGQNDVNPHAFLKELKLEEEEGMEDASGVTWTSQEVNLLLQCWAKEDIQEQLRSSDISDRAFALLSSNLATHGFDKTTLQCKAKVKLLIESYRHMKEQEDCIEQGSTWFVTLDKTLSGHQEVGEAELTATNSVPDGLQARGDFSEPQPGRCVSVSSLCLLVPTLRLMCAFAWQVVRSCNVAHFGKVDELVSLVTELVPGVLTPKERAQLLLRLRAKLVLELCRSASTANMTTIEPHMKVIQELAIGSSCSQEEVEELENSTSNFKEVVGALLKDAEERERFFKEIFPLHYGQKFDVTLHSLTWNFISKLDRLLPVPDIKQTAEWLSAAPGVIEECGQMDLKPNHLKTLLIFHEEQSDYTHKDYSEIQNSFLPTLTLRRKANPLHCSHKRQDISKQSKGEETIDAVKLSNLQLHRLNVKKNSSLNDSSLPLATCCLCPYTHHHFSGLLEHIRKEHLPLESSCSPPGKHGDTREANSPTYSPETNGVTVFPSISDLNQNLKSHLPGYQCDKCDKKYSSNSSLIVHQRIHTGEAPFLCSYCGRSFRSKGILDWHVRAHTGDRRYECHICGKTSVQHLARHMRMHRGEKNYLCSHCGKAFLSSVELRLHTRYHTGERPYKCSQCGKGFVAKCHLTRHILQHTGERPHRCLFCPKSFSSLKAKKRHMFIHQNNKSFQCVHCGRIFRIESTLKKHMEMHK
ncbi:zinc finger protein 160-like [Gouania willdenowi]|uniref:zinc finger protein 160-like n=1 Tax=Gouania willdenowi TaxID=441366 RepID=UPI0010548CA8|nr:zinc finger protein 160-like [Gouania willdenowi]